MSEVNYFSEDLVHWYMSTDYIVLIVHPMQALVVPESESEVAPVEVPFIFEFLLLKFNNEHQLQYSRFQRWKTHAQLRLQRSTHATFFLQSVLHQSRFLYV